MSQVERIFQAILYEILAILLALALVKLSVKLYHDEPSPHSLKVILVFAGISLIAMGWSYGYNLLFDKIVTGEKLGRGLWLRIGHIVGFEAGLLVFTLPILMWLLQVDWWHALMMDIGLTFVFMGYGIAFYWVYDWVRVRLMAKKTQ